jgi:hypothetical protein
MSSAETWYTPANRALRSSSDVPPADGGVHGPSIAAALGGASCNTDSAGGGRVDVVVVPIVVLVVPVVVVVAPGGVVVVSPEGGVVGGPPTGVVGG